MTAWSLVRTLISRSAVLFQQLRRFGPRFAPSDRAHDFRGIVAAGTWRSAWRSAPEMHVLGRCSASMDACPNTDREVAGLLRQRRERL